MEQVIVCTAALFGISIAALLLVCRWPGWVGFPFSILCLRFAVDAGISPFVRYGLEAGKLVITDVTIIVPLRSEEIPLAVAFLARWTKSSVTTRENFLVVANSACPARS